MDNTKILLKGLITVFVVVTLASSVLGQREWQSLTSFRDVRKFLLLDDTLWVATAGGLLAVNDARQQGISYVNTNGLGTVDIRDIIVDNDGQKWVAGKGRLIKFSPEISKQHLFFDADYNLLELYCLADDADNIWVGTDFGLVRFNKVNDGGQREDTYIDFGNLNSSPLVFDILLTPDSIWLATSAGLAVADRRDFQALKQFTSWEGFGVAQYPILGNDTIVSVAQFQSDIYVGTSQGLFRLIRTAIDTSFSQVSSVASSRVFDIVVTTDTMFVYNANGLNAITTTSDGLLPLPGFLSRATTGLVWSGKRWLSAVDGGLFYNDTGFFERYQYTGLPSENPLTLTVDHSGGLYVGFGKDMFAHYADSVWTPLPVSLGDRATDAFTSDDGRVWLATWGSGVFLVTDSGIINYDENNSSFRGIESAPQFVVVRDVASDGVNIYGASYLTLNNFAIGVGDLANLDDVNGWDSLGSIHGIVNPFVNTISVRRGQITVGTTGSGLYVCDVTGDPLTGLNATCSLYTEQTSSLVSNTIRELEYSPTGNIWVGTNFGLSRWDASIDRFVSVLLPEPIGPDITALEFDPLGNAWIGTTSGLAFMSAIDGSFETFTEANSGLVSDEITDIALDRKSGDLYISTGVGISILKSELRKRTSKIEHVNAVPNPFVIKSDADRVYFNFGQPGTVTIYSVAGELIRTLQVGSGWDGRNKRGEKVASAVYLFVITDREGTSSQGKLFLVRD